MIRFWFRYKPIMLIHWIFSTWLGSFSLFLLLPFVLAISVHMQPNLTLFPYLLLSSSPPQIRTICPWTKGILKCSTTEHGSFVRLCSVCPPISLSTTWRIWPFRLLGPELVLYGLISLKMELKGYGPNELLASWVNPIWEYIYI